MKEGHEAVSEVKKKGRRRKGEEKSEETEVSINGLNKGQ